MRFSEPAPLFPRAEKDAIERMQNLENENNTSAVDAAAGKSSADKAPPPTQAPASNTAGVLLRSPKANSTSGSISPLNSTKPSSHRITTTISRPTPMSIAMPSR